MHSGWTSLDLLRHGEPVGGLIYRGVRDDALTSEGWRQMEQAVQGEHNWGLIVSSPLSRCQEFANHVASRLNTEVHVEDGLKEMFFGDWEGKNWQEVAVEYPEESAAFWQDPSRNPPPGGETLAEFRTRICHAHAAISRKFSVENLLYITHGGVIRILLQELLGFPDSSLMQLQVPWASLTRISFQGDDLSDGELLFHNGSL